MRKGFQYMCKLTLMVEAIESLSKIAAEMLQQTCDDDGRRFRT